MGEKIPVYLHTDIGGDIDDIWALAMLLKDPRLDLKMILTDTGNSVYRAAICAKFLEAVGRSDVEVGAGIVGWPEKEYVRSHEAWVLDYPLDSYPRYYSDGISRFIERVQAERGDAVLVSIGPAPSLAKALTLAPGIARKLRFSGMFGSLFVDYRGKPGQSIEYNVLKNIPAAQKVFSAPWRSAAVTPLDTCLFVKLRGELFARIAASRDPALRCVLEAYDCWRTSQHHGEKQPAPAESTILFDTVAVHMAACFDFLEMKEMKLAITDEGKMIGSPDGMPFSVALHWRDLAGYERYLTSVLLRDTVRRSSPDDEIRTGGR